MSDNATIKAYEDTFVQDMLANGMTGEQIAAAMALALEVPGETVEIPENPEWSGFSPFLKS